MDSLTMWLIAGGWILPTIAWLWAERGHVYWKGKAKHWERKYLDEVAVWDLKEEDA